MFITAPSICDTIESSVLPVACNIRSPYIWKNNPSEPQHTIDRYSTPYPAMISECVCIEKNAGIAVSPTIKNTT